MADIFSTDNARELFQNKFIFMLGDSNMRACYKDFVQLITKNALLNTNDLRRRGEGEFQGDHRIVHSGMIKGRGYAEGREYLQNGVHIEYHFIARCYTEEVEHFLHRIKDGTMKPPDVFIMNSCLWDISRWGPHGVDAYKENMNKLMLLLKECLPRETLFIWTTTLPVSSLIRGGLLIKQIDFLQDMLRFEVMEANLFCRQLVVSHGYDVLDLHYHLRMQVHRRYQDGLHYGPLPVRLITNLLLTHISLSWGVPLPGRSKSIALERVINHAVLQKSSKSDDVVLPTLPDCVNTETNQKPNKTESVPHNNNNIAKPNVRRGPIKKKNATWKPRIWDKIAAEANGWNNDAGGWETEGGGWDNGPGPGQGYPPPARNNVGWNNRGRNVPPWQQHHQQHPHPHPPPRNQNNNNFWQDTNGHDNTQQPPWNAEFKEPYQRSTYADFDRVGGPVRKNTNFRNNRTRPY